jgi:predicted transcriptional regulator
MKNQEQFLTLSRRERQIMDIIFRLGEASVADVLNNLPDPPGYNSIRVILGILENKGHLLHRKQGQRFIYYPVLRQETVKRTALKHLLATFFEGSPANILSTLLDVRSEKLTPSELDELSEMIDKAKREVKK